MNKRLPFSEVKAAALAALPRVLDWAGIRHQQAGHEIQMLNPTRSNDDGFGSFSINSVTGVWADFASDDKGGDVVSLVAFVKGYGQGDACKDLARLFGIISGDASPNSQPAPLPPPPPPAPDPWQALLPIPEGMMGTIPRTKYKHPGTIKQFWWYHDAAGQKLGAVVRVEPGMNDRSKDYFPLFAFQHSESGKHEWRWKNINGLRPLYGLDKLAARPDATVVICEGEKAADAAAKLLPGHVAVCWMAGAKALGKADFTPLSGRNCLIWPDNDAPGEAAAQELAGILGRVGVAGVYQVDITAFAEFTPASDQGRAELAHGGKWDAGDDAADALAYGWTADHMQCLAAAQRLILTDKDETPPTPETTSSTPSTSKPRAPRRKAANPATAGGNPFKLSASGVYFQTEDMDVAFWVCGPLHILASTRDDNGENWGLLVRMTDPDGNDKEWNIPAEMLAAGEGTEIVKGLLTRGLRMGAGPKAKQRLLEYLGRYDGDARATLVNRMGWHKGAFLLPDACIGDTSEPLVYRAESKQREIVKTAGTLQQWQQEVGRYCVGNSRMLFAVSTAFAGPLMDIIGAESGGFHLYGESSQGKSTIFEALSSVYGTKDFMRSWRSTDNSLEAVATEYSDCVLPLDEIGMCDPRIVGDTIYMLGNGKGKGRANDQGGSRGRVASWRLLFLSSGEVTPEARMLEVGRKMMAGMEVRLVNIPKNEHTEFGMFECIHGKKSASAFADGIKAATAKYYGTPIRAYLDKLVAERVKVAALLVEGMKRFAGDVVPDGAHGQVHRVAYRFALVAMAGELASEWGVTGWSQGEAIKAARLCFTDWLHSRGTRGSREDDQIIARIRLFFEQNGEARFTRLSTETALYDHEGSAPDPDDHAPKTLARCGYRLKDKTEGLIKYYILPESFRTEICAGLDHNRVCKLLLELGALETTKGGNNRLQVRTTPEAKYSKSGRAWVYCITSNLFGGGHD